MRVTPANELEQLRAEARYQRERYDLYRARVYAGKPTSPARLRELQQACVSAEARVRAANQAGT
jgi:hypothetical protein